MDINDLIAGSQSAVIMPMKEQQDEPYRQRHEEYLKGLWIIGDGKSYWYEKECVFGGFTLDIPVSDAELQEDTIHISNIRSLARAGSKHCIDFLRRDDLQGVRDVINLVFERLYDAQIQVSMFHEAIRRYLQDERTSSIIRKDILDARVVPFTLFGNMHKIRSYRGDWNDLSWAIKHERSFLNFVDTGTSYEWKGAPGADGYKVQYGFLENTESVQVCSYGYD